MLFLVFKPHFPLLLQTVCTVALRTRQTLDIKDGALVSSDKIMRFSNKSGAFMLFISLINCFVLVMIANMVFCSDSARGLLNIEAA